MLPQGRTQWQSALNFYSHHYVKASFMRKDKGYWSLPKNDPAAQYTNALQLYEAADEVYNLWLEQNQDRSHI